MDGHANPKLLAGLAAACLGAALSSSAGAAPDQNFCTGLRFDIKRPLVVSKVTRPQRVYFINDAYDDASCPSDAARCRSRSYLVAGDLVLTGNARGPYVCSAYQSPAASTQDWTKGWLPASALAPVAPMAEPKDSDWIGKWVHPGGGITISAGDRGSLKIEGLQIYPTAHLAHTGDLGAQVKPSNGMIAFADDGTTLFENAGEGQCLVRMQRVGAWLAVEDNDGCGGVGVTFTGLYRRK